MLPNFVIASFILNSVLQSEVALDFSLLWCRAWTWTFQITRARRKEHTYYIPSSSGVLHLANKGEVEARSKAVLEEYRRAWAEQFPLGYDGHPVSKDVCLIHVMGWEDDGSALKEQGLSQELKMAHNFWQLMQGFFFCTQLVLTIHNNHSCLLIKPYYANRVCTNMF